MPRECRNFNNIGKGSCLLLLMLAFLAINPVITSAYAEEDVAGDTDNYYEARFSGSSSNTANNVDDSDNVAMLAEYPSTVNISFSPASAATSISPTNSTGQSAQINALATVSVQNSGGYSVYLKGNSINLIGQNNSSNIIPGATSAKTYANMDTNTWGYYTKEGTAVPDTATYKAISISGNGDKVAENTSKAILNDTKNIMLSFAAKINDEKPADTYENTVTMSVVSSPLQILTSITDMQDMTSDICTNSTIGNSKQLKDTRDGKYYWVAKLADGKCWMTQNLDLDLDASTTPLTSTTSDVSVDWTPGDAGKNPAYTETTVSSSTIYNNATGQRSWSLGNYRITNPTASSSCGSSKASAADCPSQFTAYNTPTTANGDANAHYILGNHYQWNTAMAGTGSSIASGQASSSICPKDWRLPTSGKDANYNYIGEFQALRTAGAIGSDVTKLTSSPYYFVRGGDILQDVDGLFYFAGNYGSYWSSTPNPDTSSAYYAGFNGTSTINPSSYKYRQDGFSIRCLAW